MLRRFSDVLLTLVPLILAGALTLEICVLLGIPMNFANIVALPLLLGVGVAFKIYYVVAWRAGSTNLLQSSLTRAIFYSALTTATAFGSLWFSSHPGTASMGKLLALSLATTLLAAVLFQPALMGKPREDLRCGERGWQRLSRSDRPQVQRSRRPSCWPCLWSAAPWLRRHRLPLVCGAIAPPLACGAGVACCGSGGVLVPVTRFQS